MSSLEKLAENLGLGEVLEPPVRVSGGLLHKMYRVVTAEGVFAIKLLNPEIMKRSDALDNMVSGERIARAFQGTLPLVSALEFEGRQVLCREGNYYLVFPWVEAASVFGSEITPEHCGIIGGILGKMHRKGQEFYAAADCATGGERSPAEAGRPEEHAREAGGEKSSVDIAQKDLWEEIRPTDAGTEEKGWIEAYQNALGDIREWSRRARASEHYLAETAVISHRDLDPKNVLWNGYQAWVIDWEAAGVCNPFQELLEVIQYWADDGSGVLDRKKYESLIGEYRKDRSTEKAGWKMVFDGSYRGMLDWLAYNVRRAQGIEAADAEERALGREQVLQTIRELYAYERKLRQLRRWIDGET